MSLRTNNPVSIPQGTIKSKYIPDVINSLNKFQFHKVRLKESP